MSKVTELAVLPRVSVAEVGLVTLAPLDKLRQLQRDESARLENLRREANALSEQANDSLADAGATLVVEKDGWTPDASLSPTVEGAAGLLQQIWELDRQLSELRQPHDSGFRERIAEASRKRKLDRQRGEMTRQLRSASITVAEKGRGAAASIPAALPAYEHASALLAQMEQLRRQESERAARLRELDEEILARRKAEHRAGFDVAYSAAQFQQYGLPVANGPLVLKKGEIAHVAVPAVLARFTTQSRYVGGSRGVSIPIGLGIRYRVGSYHGHTVRSQALTKVDAGTFVLSNHRIAFVGGQKTVQFPLAKLANLHIYKDGLGISREGKENADIVLLQNPHYVAFCINWAMGLS